MKKIIVVIAIAVFLTTISVSATDLEINPETIRVDLIGGNHVQVNITMNWSGSCSASCKLATRIRPDGEGINIEYSKNDFTMMPSSENIIIMYINTSMLLMPQSYTITIGVGVETEKTSEKKEEEGGGESYWSPGGYAPDYEPDIPPAENMTDTPTEPFITTLYYKNYDVQDDFVFPFWILGILGIVLLVIMLLYLISKKKKRMAEEPGVK